MINIFDSDSIESWSEGREFLRWAGVIPRNGYTNKWTIARDYAVDNPEKYAQWCALRRLGVEHDR